MKWRFWNVKPRLLLESLVDKLMFETIKITYIPAKSGLNKHIEFDQFFEGVCDYQVSNMTLIFLHQASLVAGRGKSIASATTSHILCLVKHKTPLSASTWGETMLLAPWSSNHWTRMVTLFSLWAIVLTRCLLRAITTWSYLVVVRAWKFTKLPQAWIWLARSTQVVLILAVIKARSPLVSCLMVSVSILCSSANTRTLAALEVLLGVAMNRSHPSFLTV